MTIVMTVAPHLGAQEGRPDSVTLLLPLLRPLVQSPNVEDVGAFPETSGGVKTGGIPLTALAVEDLREYEGRLQSVFSWGVDHFPADSLHRLQVVRAQAWLARLNAMSRGSVSASQHLAFAIVAHRAEDDRVAQREIDTRVSELVKTPAEQSIPLIVGVELFADPAQDSIRLARNFPIAEAYALRLQGLRSGGYVRRADSLQVVRYKELSSRLLVGVADALPETDMLRYVDRFLSYVSTLPQRERYVLIATVFPYRAVATALLHQPNGRARLDSLRTRLLAVARRRGAEWDARIPVANRPAAEASEQQDIRDSFAAFELVGHQAPPILAHAWLNTSDSTYLPTPRAHPLDDGIIRVIAFGDRLEPRIASLDRVQRSFPRGVQVIFVTATEGHAGPDLVSPVEEVAWLDRYYRERRRATFAVAVWAGAKVPQEPVARPTIQIVSAAGVPVQGTLVADDGHGGLQTIQSTSVTLYYQRYLPEPSPMPAVYRLMTRRNELIIIDGQGMIHGYHALDTRAQETSLIQRLTTLRAKSSNGAPPPPS